MAGGAAAFQNVFACTTCTDKKISIDETITVDPNTEYELEVELLRTDTNDNTEYAEIFIDGQPIGICNPDPPSQGCTYFNCSQLNDGKNVPPRLVTSATGIIQFRANYSATVQDFAPCTDGEVTAIGIARVNITKGKILMQTI